MDNLIISISGIRGIYGKSLTEDIAVRAGRAFGLWTNTENIVVGRDTRVSGNSLMQSFMAGVSSAGKRVFDCGIVPTPALTWFIEKHHNFSGTVITASHNPVEYNGIKLISPSGTFLNPVEFKDFLDIYNKTDILDIKGRAEIMGEKKDLMDNFFSCLFNYIDVSAIRKKRFKVVVDPVQGVGALYSKKFLEMLGCEIKIINENPLGKFSHQPEPVPSHLRKLSYVMRIENADIGFAQDPDCDRLVLVEKSGKFVSEEQGLAISVYWMLHRKKGPVVVNIATTRLVDDICKEFKTQLLRTKVGEVFVVEEMKRVGAVAGGEGNGGIILPEFHYGRDSYIGMGLILEMMAKTSLSLSEIIEKFPRYKFVKRKISFPRERIECLYKSLEKEFSSGKINYLDGFRIDFDDTWLGIRSSGTEPIIRIFVEGKKQSRIYRIINLIDRHVASCGRNF